MFWVRLSKEFVFKNLKVGVVLAKRDVEPILVFVFFLIEKPFIESFVKVTRDWLDLENRACHFTRDIETLEIEFTLITHIFCFKK